MGYYMRTLSCFIFLLTFKEIVTQSFPEISKITGWYLETEVQLTDRLQNASAFAREYYDGTENRGRVDFLTFGEIDSIFYYNSTGDILEVNETHCAAWEKELSVFDYYPVYVGWLVKEPLLIIGPSALLWYAEGKDTKLQPDQVSIRDITCDHFKLSVNNDVESIDYDYYFADSKWTTPYKFEQYRVPIRVEMVGETSRMTRDSTSIPVDQVVDFVYFKPVVSDLSVFQPNLGLGCFGRVSEKDLPDFPSEFKFYAEEFNLLCKEGDNCGTNVNNYQVFFSNYTKVARLDSYTLSGQKKQVFDFNNGVIYTIKDGETCNISPLRKSWFEKDVDDFLGAMVRPEEVLGLIGDFYFVDQRMMRGIECDVFESAKRHVTYQENEYYLLVTTVFFSQEYAEVITDGEDSYQVPVYILVTGYNENYETLLKMQYNIFAFDDSVGPTMYDNFAVDMCFPMGTQRAYFELQVEAGVMSAAYAEDNNAIFLEMMRSAIMRAGNLSAIRITYMKAEYTGEGIFITGIITEKPPALSQFWFENSGVQTMSDHVVIAADATTIEDCAYSCIGQTSFACRGFHFCDNACYMNKEALTVPSENHLYAKCDVYIRTEVNSSNIDAPLSKSMRLLQDATKKGDLKVGLRMGDGTITYPVLDIYVEKGIAADEVTKRSYNRVFEGFALYPAKDRQTTVEKEDIDTEYDCYRSCKDDTATSCASFSYCPLSEKKSCRISSVLMVGDKKNYDDITVNHTCNVYSLMYMDYFEAYPGQVSLLSGKEHLTVANVEECAQKCRTKTDFKCLGFEYCSKEKSCELHPVHILDIGSGKIGSAKTCTHYAARYSAEYIDMGKDVFIDDGSKRSGLTLEQCARMCSEEMSACKTFTFCEPPEGSFSLDNLCYPSEETLVTTNKKMERNDKCHLYTKRDDVEKWARKAHLAAPEIGYTKKSFTGLVIGMLIFGLIMGIAAFIGYSYYRSRQGGDGMTVRFMRQTNA